VSISVKWPAARLRGPDVSIENALEFIRRTDRFLVGDGFTNNHLFEASYLKLAGMGDDRYSGNFDWEREDRFKAAFGHIYLTHLRSRWVASSYVGGPQGPVSPSGKVLLAVNFGKWPTEEEIEGDLTKIAEAFPWLTFDLSVWGHREEGDDGPPSNSWHLEAGKWEPIEPKVLQVFEPDVMSSFMANIYNPHREITWTVPQIDTLWGRQIREARAASLREPQSASEDL